MKLSNDILNPVHISEIDTEKDSVAYFLHKVIKIHGSELFSLINDLREFKLKLNSLGLELSIIKIRNPEQSYVYYEIKRKVVVDYDERRIS